MKDLTELSRMPSYPMSQFADLEEMMCKLLNLDLREPSRPQPSLSLPMRTPGYIGQPRSNTSFSLSALSCLSADPSDSVFLNSSQWGQQSESPLTSQLANSTQWGKARFFAQRSISMVETSSTAAATLGWLGTDLKHSQSDISPTALNPSSSSSTSSSSSRYKTELCRSFTENGLCKYGGKCQFAHGPEELRDLNRHPKYKTEPCRTFHTIGFCPYGIRCHFVHNSEEEKKHSFSRSSSSSSSTSISPQPSSSSRSHRPPLMRQSFSFAGFPSAPQQILQPAFTGHPPPPASFPYAPSTSPPSSTDITDLLSHGLLEMDAAFEASPAHHYQPPMGQVTSADTQSPFLPSPDSGCSPTASPSLRQSPSVTGVFTGPLGTRSLSYTSLSDQDVDGSSSASSLSGSESCVGLNEANSRRLAVFSQFSVPEDAAGFCL
ncbi:mRNA decay activator protein ZFP36L1 isoform X2 [Mastacembelus armatus]|uniref:mRNA decay activator protein ZFP36L1 isoform X2 n=1 Tax=Mastacembelus armatus TaxID=205130 RepID=UPI000E45A460|nr:mRNA decay activator protein ZFP36L1-like isoform X2 [Mastacembelus armatus]